jgi:hypothetical protein
MSLFPGGSARSGLADWRRALCPAARRTLGHEERRLEEEGLEEPEPGGGAAMSRGLTGRRGLQALVLVLATAYATVLLYQAVAPRQVTTHPLPLLWLRFRFAFVSLSFPDYRTFATPCATS